MYDKDKRDNVDEMHEGMKSLIGILRSREMIDSNEHAKRNDIDE